MPDSARYHELRRNGLCGQCGKMPSKGCYCDFCRENHNSGHRGKYKRRKRNRSYRYTRARANKMCADCGAKSERFVYCKNCRLVRNAALRKGRNEGRYFRSWKQKYDRKYRESSRSLCGQNNLGKQERPAENA